jgi:DnaJ-class molecular chaperone
MFIYYQILGIDEAAGDKDIRDRYLELVRQHPPERDPETFQRITRAYEALKDWRGRVRSQVTGLKEYQFWTDALDTLVDGIPVERQVPKLTQIMETDNK